jgi:hypothetical protein
LRPSVVAGVLYCAGPHVEPSPKSLLDQFAIGMGKILATKVFFWLNF